jgi:hypothetical protein
MTELALAFGQPLNLGVTDILGGLFLALILGAVIALVYRTSVPRAALNPSLHASLVLLSIIGAMVMMVIGNNLARAFTLVGALAIIRFRTRLRSPWDITFIFFALANSIACGVFAYRVAILGVLVASLAVVALQATLLRRAHDQALLLRCDLAAYEAHEEAILPVLDAHLKRRFLVEARSLRFGETLSYRYRVELRDPAGVEALLRALSDVEGVERVVVHTEPDGTGETS